jgi:Raf kinase inhibitor-like YbhB/YbcL family protein
LLYDCLGKIIYFTIFKENTMFRTLLAIALSSVISLSYAADNNNAPVVNDGNVMDDAAAAPVRTVKKVKKARVVKAKPAKPVSTGSVKPAPVSETAAEKVVFEFSSPDILPNSTISKKFESDSFDCSGENRSPELQWSGAPEETKSFAVTVYDPDAPTGSGWWHWVVYDISANTEQIDAGVGTLNSGNLPENAVQAMSDYGVEAWGGMCPPKGDKPHRYVFTLHALKVEQLDVPENATSAMVRFAIQANTLATASFTAKYGRKK